MKLSDYLKRRGAAVELSLKMNISPVLLSMYKNNKRSIPTKLGAQIETATDGKVTREEMFPETWHIYWPELKNRNKHGIQGVNHESTIS